MLICILFLYLFVYALAVASVNENMISEESIYVDGQLTPFLRGVTFLHLGRRINTPYFRYGNIYLRPQNSRLCQLLRQRSVTWSRAAYRVIFLLFKYIA